MTQLNLLFATSLLFFSLLMQGCAAVVIGSGIVVGTSLAHDRRTTGTIVDDQSVEFKAMQIINRHPEIDEHSSISATSYNFSVLLTGEADTRAVKQRVTRLISEIPKVKRVVDEVTIGPSPSFSVRGTDIYLTTNAKLALFNVKIEGFDPTRVKVITRQGRVFLMGLVTREEGSAATEVVRRLNGVKRVVKVFEYKDRK